MSGMFYRWSLENYFHFVALQSQFIRINCNRQDLWGAPFVRWSPRQGATPPAGICLPPDRRRCGPAQEAIRLPGDGLSGKVTWNRDAAPGLLPADKAKSQIHMERVEVYAYDLC